MDDRHPVTGEGPDNAEQGLSDADQTVADNGHDEKLARFETARQRREVSALRDLNADERDLSAKRRDELSARRDQIAQKRDQEAVAADVKDDVSDRHTLRLEELRARARATRQRAARERERAAHDRAQAARDRQQAAHDRERAAADRRQAGTDELTGARRRGVGLEELENEMRRAKRERTSLVVAFVDVDGLKAVNDNRGHLAGDKVLRGVAAGLRRHMRSYDLLIRMGGDEFLCALPGVSIAEAQERFVELTGKLDGRSGDTVSIGFSELTTGDSPEDLVRRADADLLDSRRP